MVGFFRRKERQHIDKRSAFNVGSLTASAGTWCAANAEKRSYYELGGVREWAAGTSKSKRLLRTSCGVKQRFRTEWIDIDDLSDGTDG